MRVFIAIELPEKIKKLLNETEKQIGNENAEIKWVEEQNKHLTLRFLGGVSEEKAEEIKNKLKEVKFKKFFTSVSELGVFPSESYIRVIWVGLKPDKNIIELKEKIDFKLAEIGIEKESRFQAHITLGRVRLINDKAKLIESIKKIEMEEEAFEVNEFKLIKSTLTRKGPIYEVIEIFS